jgi:hypothetical protein
MRPVAAAAFATVLTAALSAGCASDSSKPPTHWVSVGDSYDVALKRAMYECERDTRQVSERDTRRLTFLTGKNANERTFYARCMEAHGFTRAAD